MRCLLDTSALIPLSRGDASVADAVTGVDEVLLPLVVVGEFLAGVQGRTDRRSRDALAWFGAFLEDAVVVPTGLGTCSRYAALDQTLRARGEPIPQNDVWVAAAAAELGHPLLTRDHHFDSLPGVQTRFIA